MCVVWYFYRTASVTKQVKAGKYDTPHHREKQKTAGGLEKGSDKTGDNLDSQCYGMSKCCSPKTTEE